MSLKDSLKNRIKANTESAGSYGGQGASIYSLPSDMEQMELEEKKRYRIDILPYKVETKKHPQLKPGEWDYLLDVWAHKNIGPTRDWIVCPKSTYKKPCPICEERDNLRNNDGDDKIIQDLKPSRRVLYNIYDYADKKVKLLAFSHWLFEKELLEAASASTEGEGEVMVFADPEDGYSITFFSKKEGSGKMSHFEPKSFGFVKRDNPISEEILSQAIPLDPLLNVLTYDQIKNIFLGHGINNDEGDNEDEPIKPTPAEKKRATKEESEDEPAEESATEESELQPTKEERKAAEKPAEPIEEPAVLKNPIKPAIDPRRNQKTKCPSGHQFGKDCENYPECTMCDIWESCIEGK